MCSASPQRLSVILRPRLASGLAALIIARSAVGTASELSSKVWIDAVTPVLPLEAALARHRQRTSGLKLEAAKALGGGLLKVGSQGSSAVQLQAGCSRLDVIGAAPLGHFSAELWRDDGLRLSVARGGQSAALFACNESAAAAQLEVAALERAGRYVVEQRLDPKPPALLLVHPLAATRLLARLEASGQPVDAQAAAGVSLVELAADTRRERSVSAPANRCVEWIAAVGGSASDLRLRLTEHDGSARLGAGQRVASVELCAGAKKANAKLGISVASGAAQLLLLRREASATE